jgi:hypothetical protein
MVKSKFLANEIVPKVSEYVMFVVPTSLKAVGDAVIVPVAESKDK